MPRTRQASLTLSMATHREQSLHYPIKFGFPQKGQRRGSSHPLNMGEFPPRQRIYMKFTLNGLEVTCTPAEFNELRGLGMITAERPSVPTLSVADACKAAGIPLEKTECNIDWSKVAMWPPRNEGPATKFPPVHKDSNDKPGVTLDKIAPNPDTPKPVDIKKELKDTLPKSPNVDDAIALAKDYKPTKNGYMFVYAVADRDKSRVCEYYLKSSLGDTYTTELPYALQYKNPDMAFDYVAFHPDKNLCVVRVKVPVSE